MRLSSKGRQYSLKKGDVVTLVTPGSGGYGDPGDRDREKVFEDLKNGKISKTTALDIYKIEL